MNPFDCRGVTTHAILGRCRAACLAAERAYAAASSSARDPVLRALFHVYARQRAAFVEALPDVPDRAAASYGPAPGASGEPPHQGASISPPDDDIILDDVARCDAAASRVYAAALRCGESAPGDLRAILAQQEAAIQDALADVRSRGTRRA